MKKRLSALAFVLFIPFFSLFNYCQDDLLMSVSGKLQDKRSGKPIVGGRIGIMNLEIDYYLTNNIQIPNEEEYHLSGKTDCAGRFNIKGVREGEYRIFVDLPDGLSCNFRSTANWDWYKFGVKKGCNVEIMINIIMDCERNQATKVVHNNGCIELTIYLKKKELIPAKKKLEITPSRTEQKSKCTLEFSGNRENYSADCQDEGRGGEFGYNVMVDYVAKCENSACVLQYLKINTDASIHLHTDEWYENQKWCKYGKSDGEFLYPRQEILPACIKDCAMRHEQYHFDMFRSKMDDIIKKYCDEIEKIQVCCGDDFCDEKIKKIIENIGGEIELYMLSTEDGAYAISTDCQFGCPRGNNPDATDKPCTKLTR